MESNQVGIVPLALLEAVAGQVVSENPPNAQSKLEVQSASEVQQNIRTSLPASANTVERARRYIAKVPEAIEGQGGDKQTFRVACILLKDFGLTVEQGMPLMLEYNQRCKPPWSANDLLRKLEYAAKEIGPDHIPSKINCDDWLPIVPNAIHQLESDHSEQANVAWEAPIPLGHSELPPFPIDALPDVIRDFVIAEAEATQTPADMAAMLTLSTCSAALAKKFEVRAREGWVEPINLYTVTILESGNRKSAVFSEATKPLSEYERELIAAAEPLVRESQQKRKFILARLEALRAEAAKPRNAAERERIQQEANEADRELAALQDIVAPKLISDDCTSEKLGMVLAEQDGRIACLSPEGGVFDLMAGMYSKSGMPQFGIYLHGHSGDDYRVERVSRASVWIPRPAITVGLTIQPEVLNGLVNKTAFRGRGLLARFLYAVPKSLLGSRKIAPPPVPQAIADNYRRLVRSLCQLPFAIEPTGERTPHFLQLSEAAQEVLQGFEAHIEPQLGTGGEMELLKDWGGKLAGTVVRLAGILHVLRHCHEPAPWDTPISGETMQSAIRIGEYLIAHAEAALELMGADEGLENAKYILQWIKRHERESFNRRELHQAAKRRFKKPEDLDAPLSTLVAHCIIRQKTCDEPAGPGRPSSPAFEVNPAIHSPTTSDGVAERVINEADGRPTGEY